MLTKAAEEDDDEFVRAGGDMACMGANAAVYDSPTAATPLRAP